MTKQTETYLENGTIVKAPPSGDVLLAVMLKGDGIQAPGAVTLCKSRTDKAAHPYVVWFHNRQTGGYHNGDYCKTFAEGIKAFNDKIERCGPHLVVDMAA